MPESNNGGSYGSIEGNDVEDPKNSFQEASIYYLQEPNLSCGDRFKKLLLIGVPVLIALLVIGGAASLLFRDFDHLYPGPGGDSSYTKTQYGGVASDDDIGESSPLTHRGPQVRSSVSSNPDSRGPQIPSGTSASSKASEGGVAACAAHQTCRDLGLQGDCCPTGAGIFLSCC